MELTVFRNVGTENLDAGESPKRNNTNFTTWRKFEIKHTVLHCSGGCLPEKG